MKQKRLLQHVTVEIPSDYLQAFCYFLTRLWEEVEIGEIRSKGNGLSSMELSTYSRLDGGLIHQLWTDWKDSLIYESYAIMN